MSKGKNSNAKMKPKAARRIQSNADRTGSNQGFKRRAQRGAARNSGAVQGSKGKGPKGKGQRGGPQK